jgi:hypothetical protein
MAKAIASPQAIINKTDMSNGKTVFFFSSSTRDKGNYNDACW